MLESQVNPARHSTGGLLPLMRQRFGEEVATSVIDESGITGDQPVIPAAVLIPVVLRESGPTVLLTQRTAHLRDHAGQVSFPGGRSEEQDASPEATALREAEEEVGLPPEQVEILGRLPRYRTGTGFIVTPVLGLVTPPLNLKLDDFEVAEVFEPPLGFLLNPENHQRSSIMVRGVAREFWAMPWQGYYIWGATAGMLVCLYQFLYPPETTPPAKDTTT